MTSIEQQMIAQIKKLQDSGNTQQATSRIMNFIIRRHLDILYKDELKVKQCMDKILGQQRTDQSFSSLAKKIMAKIRSTLKEDQNVLNVVSHQNLRNKIKDMLKEMEREKLKQGLCNKIFQTNDDYNPHDPRLQQLVSVVSKNIKSYDEYRQVLDNTAILDSEKFRDVVFRQIEDMVFDQIKKVIKRQTPVSGKLMTYINLVLLSDEAIRKLSKTVIKELHDRLKYTGGTQYAIKEYLLNTNREEHLEDMIVDVIQDLFFA